MEKTEYRKIVSKYKPREDNEKNLIISFITGGIIGLIGEFLTELYSCILDIPTKDAVSLMLVSLIFIACFLTAIGIFDDMVKFCRCGLIIPITGFAHSMMSAGMEYKKEGLVLGIGSNVFKLAGSVILYGVVSAWLFASIRYIIFGG